MKQDTMKKIEKANTSMLTVRTTQFYQPPKDLSMNTFNSIEHIQLQCEGYSLFHKDEILINFQSFITRFLQISKKHKEKILIKTLKINFNGFSLQGHSYFFKNLAEGIKSIGQNIKTLWIHTSDLDEVTLQNFSVLLELLFGFGAGNDVNFQEFSLQCANWNFKNHPPKWDQLKQQFQKQFINNRDFGNQVPLKQKHVRIEMSGWYYTAADAKIFLGFSPTYQELQQILPKYRQFYKGLNRFDQFDKQVQKFHVEMQSLITNLVQLMDQTLQFQIDMRNTNEILKMKNLKRRLLTSVTKSNKSQRSLISMRQNMQRNQQQEEKQFRLNITM